MERKKEEKDLQSYAGVFVQSTTAKSGAAEIAHHTRRTALTVCIQM
jgi:hypothetical protein